MSASLPGRPAQNPKPARNPISRKQIEIVASRSVAIGSIVFAAQSALALLGEINDDTPIWTYTIVGALIVSLLLSLVCSLIVRFVRGSQGIVALVFALALITWPLQVVHAAPSTGSQWLYGLLNVGTSTAVVAFSSRLSAAYLFIVPSIYGIIRITPAGGAEPPADAILASIYSMILGGAVVVVITMLRQTATNVDIAQSAALDRYGRAVRQHATEIERVQVDSIVHDSVLTTLISAARAYTPEAKKLAAVMAGNAIGYLHEAALVQPDDGSTVRLRATAQRIADAAAELARPFRVTVTEVGPRSIPVSVGESIASAAQQAMFNSVQHGGDSPRIRRWVTIKGVRPGGIEIEIGDSGVGFAADSVPTERLGVRVSIIERVTNAGGVARIASSPGHGTIVSLRWPAPKSVRDAQERAQRANEVESVEVTK